MEEDNNISQNDDSFGLNEATPAIAPVETAIETTVSELQDDSTEHENAISSTTSETSNLFIEKQSDLNSEPDTDFFAGELSISDVSAEKINENVEDIVQDLENLLGESSFTQETYEKPKFSQSYEYLQKRNVCEAESTNFGELPSSSLDCDDTRANEVKPAVVDIVEGNETSNIVTTFEAEAVELPNKETTEDKIIEENVKVPVDEGSNTASFIFELHELQSPVTIESKTVENETIENVTIDEETIEKETVMVAESKGIIGANLNAINEAQLNPSESENKDLMLEENVTEIETVESSETENVIVVPKCELEIFLNTPQLDSEPTDSNKVVSAGISYRADTVSVSETVCIDGNDDLDAMNIELSQLDNTSEKLTEAVMVDSNQDVEEDNKLEHQQIEENEAAVSSISKDIQDDIVEKSQKDDPILDSYIDSSENNLPGRNEIFECTQVNPSDTFEVQSNMGMGIEIIKAESELKEAVMVCIENPDESPLSLEISPIETRVCDSEYIDDGRLNVKSNSELDVVTESCDAVGSTIAHNIDELNLNLKLLSDTDVSTTGNSSEENLKPESEIIESHGEAESMKPESNETILSLEEQCSTVKVTNSEQPPIEEIKENLVSLVPIQTKDESLVSRSTELDQPLTVEVDDPDFVEEQVPETSTKEDKVEKKTKKGEVIEIARDVDIEVIPRPTIEEESHRNRAPLKMTITKNKSENVHSILKIYDPNEVESSHESHIPKLIIKSTSSSSECVQQSTVLEEPSIPKITIKPVLNPFESQHSPRLTIKPIKPPTSESEKQYSPKLSVKPISPSTSSPKITIKPIIKPETLSPLKLTIRSIPNSEELQCSPKLTIKPITKSEETLPVEMHHSPKITIKPIIKPSDEAHNYPEERCSPRITIKPIIKPPEECDKSENESIHTSRLTIKPIIKPPEEQRNNDQPLNQPFKLNIKPVLRSSDPSASPKITIKPVPKPEGRNEQTELTDFEDQIKQERIVLKIPRNSKKEKNAPSENEKLKKIKLKFSKAGGLAHIVPVSHESSTSLKRSSENAEYNEMKHFKVGPTIDLTSDTPGEYRLPPGLTITRVENVEQSIPKQFPEDSDSSDDVKIISVTSASDKNLPPNLKTSKSVTIEVVDPLASIPIFEITPQATLMSTAPTTTTTSGITTTAPVTPRKRGRPRKVPLQVREEFKDPKEEEVIPTVVIESSRPKRSCRGTSSVRQALGIRPRKPRGAARGRGAINQRTVSTRATTAKKAKMERKTPTKLKGLKESMVKESDFKEFDVKDVEFKQVPLPASDTTHTEVVIYEEETRMSAENSSRAQTPAKQVLSTSTEVIIEESQSSVQSSTTTESSEKLQKNRRGPRLEVHQEPEGEVISADKLAEYSWGGGGPYMLQEQVAQFLGIKSFKRKYPGIQRRPVEMQERDFIRETGLASEAMCDMGLTAVRSEDILDIMYTDFQHKYEEYCKHQRDRQAKDVSNKQKALSLAASQEKNKLDIVEQAVQSAFQWNASFNKARREQRRACMDLQTFTVHFPKGRMKQVNKAPVDCYPLALVPGQFTDYYKKYSPLELSNLPLNTIGCKSIGSANQDTEESQSDGSASDSDSSSSDSDSSDSGSSGVEDCKMCSPIPSSGKKILVR